MSDTEKDVIYPEELYIKEEDPEKLDIKEESVEYCAEGDEECEYKFIPLPSLKEETGDGSITGSQSAASVCKETNFGIFQEAKTKEEVEYRASCDTTVGYQHTLTEQEDLPQSEGKRTSTTKARHIVNRTLEWTSCLIIDLLEKIRSKPVLWDVRNPSYHKKTLRRSNFDVVCNELKLENPLLQNLTTDEVIAKFAYLRGHYQKQLRKIQKKTPRGSGGIVQSKWEYFEACSFLKPIYSKNIITASSQSEDVQEIIIDRMMEEFLESSETSPLRVSSPEPPSSSLSPVPTVAFPPRSPPTCTSPTKKRKHLNTQGSVQEKLVEAVNAVNTLIESRNTVMKNDMLALTVSSVLSHIPDTHQHLKDEFAAQVMCLAADILKKYNSEKYGQ